MEMNKEELKNIVSLCLSDNEDDTQLAKNIIAASRITIENLKEFALIELLYLLDDNLSGFNTMRDNLLVALSPKFKNLKGYCREYIDLSDSEYKEIKLRDL